MLIFREIYNVERKVERFMIKLRKKRIRHYQNVHP